MCNLRSCHNVSRCGIEINVLLIYITGNLPSLNVD